MHQIAPKANIAKEVVRLIHATLATLKQGELARTLSAFPA
jgi:hypothetical protein